MPRGSYDNTQHGWFHWLLYTIAAVQLAGAFVLWNNPGEDAQVTRVMLMVMSGVLGPLGLCFQHLRVRDRGDDLEIRFGPLPLLRRRVRYADITHAEPSRSKVIEGWGVHLSPGGGWIWNIWGRDVVELTLTNGRLRVGTNDPDGLIEYLQTRIGSRAAS
jgi:hypothetical protein